MSKKQYIAAAMCAVLLAALFWAVPALVNMDELLWAAILGAVCLSGMMISVFKGGLTDVFGK